MIKCNLSTLLKVIDLKKELIVYKNDDIIFKGKAYQLLDNENFILKNDLCYYDIIDLNIDSISENIKCRVKWYYDFN